MKYLDTGLNDSEGTLGKWFEGGMLDAPNGIWVQAGYFGYESLVIHEDRITDLVKQGHPVHFVLGANQGSLSADSLNRLLKTLEAGKDVSVTVVAFSNALFHPKTFVIRQEGEKFRAYIGSSNLTGAGMGLNVEAGISLATEEGDDLSLINSVIESTMAWAQQDEDGIFIIRDSSDVDELVAAKIISLHAPRKSRSTTTKTGAGAASPNRGTTHKKNLYPIAPRAPLSVAESTPWKATPGTPRSWTKTLSKSDAQQVKGPGSHKTGNLKLSQARHDIDHNTWFREILFDDVEWKTVIRNKNKAYEFATVPFEVTIMGNHMGVKELTVDHGPHRSAGQGNVPTWLLWGKELLAILEATPLDGRTVTLSRNAEGIYQLTIA